MRCSFVNVLNGHNSFIFMYTQRNGWSEGGLWNGRDASVTIRACYRDALRLFRTNVEPSSICKENGKITHPNRFRRVCPFCTYMFGVAFVIDAYHVMMECPLHENARAQLLNCISPNEFVETYGVSANVWE